MSELEKGIAELIAVGKKLRAALEEAFPGDSGDSSGEPTATHTFDGSYMDKQPMDKQPMAIPSIQYHVHKVAKEHGWWDEERELPELCALLHSEVSELLEADRKGVLNAPSDKGIPYEGGQMTNLQEELADIMIRTLDMCERFGVDAESVILAKTAYNESRPYRHGKKF